MSANLFIAGGSVLRALTVGDTSASTRTADRWTDGGDVDVFLHGLDAAAATSLAKRIARAVAVTHERWLITRSNGVLNLQRFELHDGQRSTREKVQIVLRLYKSPAEILAGFDCDCICCGYDGTAVWALPRCVRALRTGVNVLNPLHAWPNKPTYEFRLAKCTLSCALRTPNATIARGLTLRPRVRAPQTHAAVGRSVCRRLTKARST